MIPSRAPAQAYISGLDTDCRRSLLRYDKTFLSVGHDEYWSGGQRANVDAARDAGVNLAFFSGNEVYWKTWWEPSVDGSQTEGRTLVCYKETWDNAKSDPSPEWTGTWRDPRFTPTLEWGAAGERPDRHGIHVQRHRPADHGVRGRGPAALLARHCPGRTTGGRHHVAGAAHGRLRVRRRPGQRLSPGRADPSFDNSILRQPHRRRPPAQQGRLPCT